MVYYNCIIYGDHIVVRPSTIPYSSEFIQWATLLSLYGIDDVVLGNFTFEAIREAVFIQIVGHNYWN